MSYALLALGADRTGIVAGISAVLVRHGVNIEDSQMSILQGQFAMVLILAAPADLDLESLRSELGDEGRRLGLEAVVVNEVPASVPQRAEPTHAITVYGGDHPGIVHAVSAALAEADVNVTGLTTRLGGADEPIYLMILEVAAPEDVDPGAVLGRVAEEQAVEVRVQPLEPATL
jgi:predicted amino acid-binding ACT domain protein